MVMLRRSISKTARLFDTDVQAKLQAIGFKFDKRFDALESTLRVTATELYTTAADIMGQQKDNETRLVWRLLVFTVNHVLNFAIFYVLILYRF